jgi:hypothetical protein
MSVPVDMKRGQNGPVFFGANFGAEQEVKNKIAAPGSRLSFACYACGKAQMILS